MPKLSEALLRQLIADDSLLLVDAIDGGGVNRAQPYL